MSEWIVIAVIIVATGGIALVVFRPARGRRDRGQDVWIGGDMSSGSAEGGGVMWNSTESGAGAVDDFSGGGDFGGGGASGDWVSGGGDSGGGDSGGGDGGGSGD